MAALSKLWLRLRGDYTAIADGYYRAGKLSQAAQLYARAGNFEEAARLSARAGDEEKAMGWLARLRDPLKAGELLAAEGLDKRAVPYLEEGGAFWRAGECALRSGQPLRAAHLFERGAALEKAAECYEIAGDTEGVLRVLKRQSAAYARDREDANRRRTDLKRAKILSKLGRFADAAAILESCGRPLLAAELWQKAGNAKRAVRAYLDGGSPQRAAGLLDQVGDLGGVERAELLSAVSKHDEAALVYDEAGETSLAIEQWEAAGNFIRAAELLEKTGQFDRAADLYYRGGRYAEAARCFMQAGELRSSAQALSQSGDHRGAARRYLDADEPLQAAREFVKGEEVESARSALRSVEQDSHEYESAVLLLVPLLVDAGDHGEALDRLDTLSPSSEPSSIAAKSYWQGRANEGQGDFARAARAYQRALDQHDEFLDSQARLEEMRRRMQQGVDVSPLATQEIGVSVVELGPGALLEGRFEIVAEIGRGGMSRVYRAYDRERGETLAVKVLLPRFEDTDKGESRLLNEVRISRKLRHPNIVRVYDFGRFPGGIFVTMELIEGKTLDRVLKEEGRLSVSRTKALLEDVLCALREAHAVNILHRDLKPANVAVTSTLAKLMDFGIARAIDSEDSLTQSGQVIGSPMYMSPEQIQGLPLDPRTDLYSVGVLAFTLLAGFEPFLGKTAAAVTIKHLQQDPPALREIRANLDLGWYRLIDRLLEKDRDKRPHGADDVLTEIRRLPGH